MKKTILTAVAAGMFAMILGGCAGDNYNPGYNSYDNRSDNERKIDYAAQDEAYKISDNLSAQDVKNLNNLK